MDKLLNQLIKLVSEDDDIIDPDGIRSCEDDEVGELYKCKFNLVNQRSFGIECFRQWVILLLSIGMIAFFSYCLYKLYKTQRAFTFDFLMILIETFKFIFIQMITLLLIMIFQSQIRAIVCANFIKKALVATQQEHKLNQSNKSEDEQIIGLLDDQKQKQCLELQIKRLSIGYLLFAIFDLMLLGIGNVIDSNEHQVFFCVESWYLLYIEAPAVWFILFHMLFFYVFSILIWYIFYQIPNQHGLIKRMYAKDLRMTQNYKSTISTGNLKESEVVEEFMKATQNTEIAPVSPLLRKITVINDTSPRFITSPNQYSPKNKTMISKQNINFSEVNNYNFQSNLNGSGTSQEFKDVHVEADDISTNNQNTNSEYLLVPNPNINNNQKKKKKYNMFNKPEVTGSVYSKTRNNSKFDN
ncbi:UNKNOWN [Stylonychia lemnae]|uniref:Transmembrane protein n=1 Tax=Stylonychia lemnae TaxID=5949 RepID=A0A078B901_STYLE|nr:UNKNOWN [Stylonychia lemnae]|eukprot:CDW90980.1 UNKNOWN [Stylonychia lemnae]